MGRVVIASAENAARVDFPALHGLAPEGAISTRALIAGQDRPICLWLHELPANTLLRWTGSPVDHLLYLWQGQIECGDSVLADEGAVVVEHGGEGALRASRLSLVLHFHRPEGHPEAPSRSGGSVHAMTADSVPRGTDGRGLRHALFADAACPSCELWLHRTDLTPGFEAPRHHHTEDEIIFIVAGAMHLGRRVLPPGGAVAIDKETVYGFQAGPGGLGFINFRPRSPYAIVGDNAPVNESEQLRNLTSQRKS